MSQKVLVFKFTTLLHYGKNEKETSILNIVVKIFSLSLLHCIIHCSVKKKKIKNKTQFLSFN